MKTKSWLRDLCITAMVLFVGLGLVWAGNANMVDVLMTLAILLVPMVSLFMVARNWPKPDFDN